MNLDKIRNLKIAKKLILIASGITLTMTMAGCSLPVNTNLILNDNTFPLTSLDVLSKGKEFHICRSKVYKEKEETILALEPVISLDGDGNIQVSTNMVSKDVTTELKEYIDIKSKELIATDEEMNEYNKSSAYSYFNYSDYETNRGTIPYDYAREKIQKALKENITKEKSN